jgi:hypothetical protein
MNDAALNSLWMVHCTSKDNEYYPTMAVDVSLTFNSSNIQSEVLWNLSSVLQDPEVNKRLTLK